MSASEYIVSVSKVRDGWGIRTESETDEQVEDDDDEELQVSGFA